MKVGIIGTGYVGLPTGVGLAEIGHDVICCDRDQAKINSLRAGRITLYEADLEDLFQKNIQAGRITFTTSLKECVENSQVVIIAVGTPPNPVTKEADLKYVHSAASSLAEYIKAYTVVVVKSTVPVGTGDAVDDLIKDKVAPEMFDVVSMPEFLREGFAVQDFFQPDRIVVGTDSPEAVKVIRELYQPFRERPEPVEILFVQRRSSEIIKYASNAFLAIKIHYINEMADFCEKTGADVREVARGMGLDSRIGPKFLNPGPGYGGSCFPKDTCAIAFVAKQNEVKLSLVNAAIDGNQKRKSRLAERVLNAVANVKAPKIAVLGLTFKEGTDDCRESPAMAIIAKIIDLAQKKEIKLRISAYDPQGLENARKILGDQITYAQDVYEALHEADLLLVLTEWPRFKALDLAKAHSLMRCPIIIDLRNILDPEPVLAAGFSYQNVGCGFQRPEN